MNGKKHKKINELFTVWENTGIRFIKNYYHGARETAQLLRTFDALPEDQKNFSILTH